MDLKPSGWKKNHPGIPDEWSKLGEGGNAIVWRADDLAIKRLKPTASAEARARFRRECSLMVTLRGRDDLKIVPVVEVRHREGADEIMMTALTGNLEMVIDRFRAQPLKAAAALLPIVETLAILSEADPRIHHRDLKPTNLLYSTDEADLYLGDFGCAFLSDGERITPNRRALGAWAFRPPEYSGGAVEDVGEKGDVFSMGKVFWSMINGVAHVTFPGPVWFLPEYDLASICGEANGVSPAMYIIARCCSIRPESRPSLRELATMLATLESGGLSPAVSLGASVLINEQQQEIEYAQRRAIARPFVVRLTEDMGRALQYLREHNPDSLMLKAWTDEWNRNPHRSASLVAQVVDQESDAPVMNVHRRQQLLFTRIYPEGMHGGLRFVASFGPMNEQHTSPRLTVEALSSGLSARIEGLSPSPETSIYTASTIAEFLARAIAAA